MSNCRKALAIATAALGGAAVYKYPAIARLARASGVSREERGRTLPGDDLIPGATVVMDRVGRFDYAPAEVWPWLEQLGKGRAGWYMPRGPEAILVPVGSWRGAREILPEFQNLTIGERVPDYGREEFFEVAAIDPPRALVYRSARGWPKDKPLPEAGATVSDEVLAFSWALVLDEPVPGRTRLHLRLRARKGQRESASKLLSLAGGLFDYATVELMFAGLRERLAEAAVRSG